MVGGPKATMQLLHNTSLSAAVPATLSNNNNHKKILKENWHHREADQCKRKVLSFRRKLPLNKLSENNTVNQA